MFADLADFNKIMKDQPNTLIKKVYNYIKTPNRSFAEFPSFESYSAIAKSCTPNMVLLIVLFSLFDNSCFTDLTEFFSLRNSKF